MFRNNMNNITGIELTVIISGIAVAIIAAIIFFGPTISRDSSTTVTNHPTHLWPIETIIHQTYDNNWYCLEFPTGDYIMYRHAGRASVATTVENCTNKELED